MQPKYLQKEDSHSGFVHVKLTTDTHTHTHEIYFSEGKSLAKLSPLLSADVQFIPVHTHKKITRKSIFIFCHFAFLVSSGNTWIFSPNWQKMCPSPIGRHCKAICSHLKTKHNLLTQPATTLILVLTDPAINCASSSTTYSLSGT